MNFSDNVKSTVDEKLVPNVVDTITNSSPFNMRILGNQKPWTGTKMKFPIKYATNTSGGDFDGLDKFTIAKTETREMMEFSPTGHYQTVTLSGMELDVNATDKQVIDLLKIELATAQTSMIDRLADRWFAYQSDKAFLGLYDAVDDGDTAASYGGLTRSTYTGIRGNLTDSTGTLTAAKMRTMMSSCVHGNDKPDMIITTKAVFGYYEALVENKVSANYQINGYPQLTRTGIAPGTQALKGQLGFDAVWFSGVPVVVDEKIDTGYMAFVNSKHLAFYGLKSTKYTPIQFTSSNLESVYSDIPVTTGFAWSGLLQPIDQYGVVGQIILQGNLISDSPRHLGLLTGITS